MKRKYAARIPGAIFLLALTASIVFLLLYSAKADVRSLVPIRCTMLTSCEWETASGRSGTLLLPGYADADGLEPVTYRLTLPETIRDNEWLCVQTMSSIELRINGELRKTFDENTVGIPGSIEKSTFLFCELTREDAGGVAELTLKSPYAPNFFLRPLYLGDIYSIQSSIVMPSLSRFIWVLVLFMLSSIDLIMGLGLSYRRRSLVSITFVSTGILLVSLWLMLDDYLYPFFLPNAYVEGLTSYLIAVLAPFPFMQYIDRLQKQRHHTIFFCLEILDLCYFGAVCAARFLFGISLASHLLIYNLPIAVLSLCCVYPILADVIAGNGVDYKIMLYGIITLMAMSLLDIVLINMPIERTDGNLVLAGLYVLSFSALFQQVHDSHELYRALDHQNQQINTISKQNRDLELRAQTDSLTGLYNYDYLHTAGTDRIAARQEGALLMFDLDNFKHINDTYGHLEGDRVLIAFADALRRSFRRDDFMCRPGGDEFVVFMGGPVSEEQVKISVEQLLFRFRNDPQIAAYRDEIGASVGAAYIPMDSTDPRELYRLADARMYMNKNDHR